MSGQVEKDLTLRVPVHCRLVAYSAECGGRSQWVSVGRHDWPGMEVHWPDHLDRSSNKWKILLEPKF